MLVERDDELASLEDLLLRHRQGNSGAAIITGSAGCGKTTLLTRCTTAAAAGGILCLRAAAAREERELPLGVVTQLFQSAEFHQAGVAVPGVARIAQLLRGWNNADLNRAPQDGGMIEPRAARVVRELADALLRLATTERVVIAIDDVHDADELSLRWLRSVLGRWRTAPVLAVLTECSSPDYAMSAFNADLVGRSFRTRRLHVVPLSANGVGEVLAEKLGTSTAARTRAACEAATGGNPMLVQAFIADRRAAQARSGRPIAPASSDEMFREAVLRCVHRCGPSVVDGARAIALLGHKSTPSLVARLLDSKPGAVAKIVTCLEAAGLLNDGRFSGAAARSAILDDIPCSAKADLHQRAAELLHAMGTEPITVADHLASGTHCPPWGVRVYQQAAEYALAADQSERALDHFQLALRACDDEGRTAEISLALAQVEWRINPATTGRLPQLLKAFQNGHLNGEALRVALRHLVWLGQFAQAATVLDLLADAEEPRSAVEPRGIGRWLASCYPTVAASHRRGRGQLDLDLDDKPLTASASSPLEGAATALTRLLRRGPGADVIALAESVLEGCQLMDSTIEPIMIALLTLVYADCPNRARPWSDALLREAAARGGRTWQAILAAVGSEIALRQGDVSRAESHAQSALSLIPDQGWGVVIGLPRAAMIRAATAARNFDVAAKTLAAPVPPSTFQSRWGLSYQHARGLYYLATDRPRAALGDFLACGKLMMEWNIDLPGFLPWRADAALACLRLGRRHEAEEFATAQLERPGALQSRTHGISLRSLAACQEPRRRPRLLRTAVDKLTECGDTLELARALADLSDAYAELGDDNRARMILTQATNLAREHSIDPRYVRTDAREDMFGQAAQSATEAVDECLTVLSEAERRVATLAAMGHTNREIAHKLRVTPSTVEQHLTRVYRKLNVSHRADLSGRLMNLFPGGKPPPGAGATPYGLCQDGSSRSSGTASSAVRC